MFRGKNTDNYKFKIIMDLFKFIKLFTFTVFLMIIDGFRL